MADLIRKMQEGHTVEDLDTVIDEVYEARGEYDSLGERLDDMEGGAPIPSTSIPAMDGTGSAGTSSQYARADHVHPSDTSKQNALSSTQLAAVNSGIDSTKVEQIETNKNNISKQQNTTAQGGNGYAIINGVRQYTGDTIAPPVPPNSLWLKDSVKVKTDNYFNTDDFGAIQVDAQGNKRNGTNCGILPQGTYTLSATTSAPQNALFHTIKSGSTYTMVTIVSLPYTFTADGVSEQIIRVANATTTSWAENGYTNIMLNTGSTAESYTPYWTDVIDEKIKPLENNISLTGYADKIISTSFNWSDGFIGAANGSVNSSNQSQFSQPFLLHAGEKITVQTLNTNIGLICTTTADTVQVGDTVTVLQATSGISQEEAYSYTASEDIKIVICVLKSNYDAYISQKSSLPLCDWVTLKIRSMQST